MSKVTKAVSMFLNRNGSKMLIGVSFVSMGSAIIMAARSTTKYELLLEEEIKEKGHKLSKKEKIKPIFKAYWPSILLAVLSASCSIGSHVIEKKHQAVLAAALTVSNTALNEFQSKAIEHLGEKKVTEIKDAIAKDHIDKNKPDPNSIIVANNKGKVLMFDDYSGRYFYSDIESIRRAVNTINRRIPEEQYCTLNDLYSEIGVPEIDLGDRLGWHNDYDDKFEEKFSAQISDNGEPCIVVSYEPHPSVVGYFRD